MASLVSVELVSRCTVVRSKALSDIRAPSYLDENNVGAGFGEANRDSLANAAGAAGDYGRVAFY